MQNYNGDTWANGAFPHGRNDIAHLRAVARKLLCALDNMVDAQAAPDPGEDAVNDKIFGKTSLVNVLATLAELFSDLEQFEKRLGGEAAGTGAPDILLTDKDAALVETFLARLRQEPPAA